jgi:N-acetylmuramic acid 6-phosphate etherase
MPVQSKWQSLPTEQINPATLAIDKLAPADIVEGMLNEDRKMLDAVRREKERIAVGIEIITQALRKNGRVIFVGAGTSGRLGVLDASEAPPTFGVEPELVRGIIAGGDGALRSSIEGAEDDALTGARDVRENVRANDVLVGISASGRARYVIAALVMAREIGAFTVALTCDPLSPLAQGADEVIVLDVGPEILAGSSRLKAGTATKLVLNMLSTTSMVKIGRTRDDLMVDLRPTNEKLRQRAIRLVEQEAHVPAEEAKRRLETWGWHVRAAIEDRWPVS